MYVLACDEGLNMWQNGKKIFVRLKCLKEKACLELNVLCVGTRLQSDPKKELNGAGCLARSVEVRLSVFPLLSV